MENLGVFRGIIVLQEVSGMSRGATGSALEERHGLTKQRLIFLEGSKWGVKQLKQLFN